jgi:membrane protease YdiL (CAAX protease family)
LWNGPLRWHWPGDWDHAAYALAQLVIWSPLPFALWLRRQRAASAWTGADHLVTRLAVGFVLGCVAVTFFLAARGELSRWPAIAAKAFTWRSLAHAAPVYLEGVGIAYIYVRLQWVVGSSVAALIPAVLFAIAHVPRALDAGESAASIAVFFGFNLVFVTTLLLVLRRYRDVVAVGVVHFLMDLATNAF